MASYAVALIGGIGAGKSLVLDIFESFGVTTLSADKIARELVEPHTPTLAKIVSHFGQTILNPDKSLNRSALRALIFQSVDEKKWLENLLHPQIRTILEQRAHAITTAYGMIEIPLLTDKKDYPYINRVLLVKAKRTSRIQRVTERDETTPDKVKAIIDTQMSDGNREALADDMVENNSSITALKTKCETLHHFYCKEANRQ